MRTIEEIDKLITSKEKEVEKVLNTKIRNGQHLKGIREALKWVKEQAGSSVSL